MAVSDKTDLNILLRRIGPNPAVAPFSAVIGNFPPPKIGFQPSAFTKTKY
jgi:hypothetical protein